MKRLLPLIVSGIVLALTAVAQGQSGPQPPMSQYEKFVRRTDVVIVTQSYPVGSFPGGGGGYKVLVHVSTAVGNPRKFYGARLSDHLVDFAQLAVIQDGLDKMIRAIHSSSETPNTSSISYKSPFGVSANYYSFKTDGADEPKWNMYLVAGTYTYQSTDVEILKTFRDLIAQARQKLISLGAR